MSVLFNTPREQLHIAAVISDMDGVLWRDAQPIGDLPRAFAAIRRLGWQAALATNNATRTVAQYQDKLSGFGVELAAGQIVNSSQAVLHYLRQLHPQGGAVYVVGEQALVDTLAEGGFFHRDSGEDALAVIGSLDRGFSYARLERAATLIRRGAPFLGTNPDLTFPAPGGLVPGAGAMLAAIKAASGERPLILGKPAPRMYRVALERMGVLPQRTLVVGDRLETDIAGAQQIGCRAALVLSGVSSLAEAQAWTPAPDIIAPDLSALLEAFLHA